jgi:hypothetical protein
MCKINIASLVKVILPQPAGRNQVWVFFAAIRYVNKHYINGDDNDITQKVPASLLGLTGNINEA